MYKTSISTLITRTPFPSLFFLNYKQSFTFTSALLHTVDVRALHRHMFDGSSVFRFLIIPSLINGCHGKRLAYVRLPSEPAYLLD